MDDNNKYARLFYDDSFLIDLGKYIEAKQHGESSHNFLTEKKFTIKDLDTTYRIINHWSQQGLFDDSRDDNKGWRKFSLVDMVWLRVLLELRKFGISLDKMRVSYESISKNSEIFEFAIASCLMKRGMYLFIFPDGYTEIATKNVLNLSESSKYLKEASYLTISLNRCLELIFPGKNYSPKLDSFELSDKEISTLAELRLSDIDSLLIQMKNGDIEKINITKKYKDNIGKLSDLLNKVSFGDVEIKRVQGKTAFVEVTEKVKL